MVDILSKNLCVEQSSTYHEKQQNPATGEFKVSKQRKENMGKYIKVWYLFSSKINNCSVCQQFI